MKSVKTKITALVVICTVLASVLVGTLSIGNARSVIQEDSTKLMHQACENSQQEIDALISRISQSVEMLAACAMNGLDDIDRFQTESAYVSAYTDSMENTLVSAADNTEGAISAYLRFNPEFTEPTSGLFFSRNSAAEEFNKLVPTDFSIYDKSDTAHVGWYYIPVENRKATWMSPYLNENIGIYMISYVVPLYKDDIPVGIVGMDIDFSFIEDVVDKTHVYDTGYAFLADADNLIMHHNALPINQRIDELNMDGKLNGLCEALKTEPDTGSLVRYEYEGTQKEMVYRNLKNGMKLVLTAPLKEINQGADKLIFQILFSALAVVIVSVVLAIIIIGGVVRPIEELNKTARKIAEGDLEVTVSCSSQDEIGTLAKSIELTVERLRQYINYIQEISEVLEEIANGNLVFELQYDYVGEFSIVKESLHHISKSLNHTLREINKASEQVTNGSEQVAEGAQVLSQGAVEQAASVQELSATVQEISMQVNQNAKNAREATSMAGEAGNNVIQSNEYMGEMAKSMENIAAAADKINEIVKTVEDIASKTNILALNASIESARAGEAGKGFAVVAGEVRTLAEQVGEATRTIADLVRNANTAIDEGIGIVRQAEDSLKSVVEKSVVIEQKIQEIADASELQADSLKQINVGVGQISAIVETNTQTAGEEAAASKEMSSQARILRNLIEQFKLEG